MRLALAQLNFTVGAFDANVARMTAEAEGHRALRDGGNLAPAQPEGPGPGIAREPSNPPAAVPERLCPTCLHDLDPDGFCDQCGHDERRRHASPDNPLDHEAPAQ